MMKKVLLVMCLRRAQHDEASDIPFYEAWKSLPIVSQNMKQLIYDQIRKAKIKQAPYNTKEIERNWKSFSYL
jgi:hypothetical protein